MTGTELFLKQLGVDIKQIQEMPALISAVAESFRRIEAKIDSIHRDQQLILSCLHGGPNAMNEVISDGTNNSSDRGANGIHS